jgi:SAM-dependent methyltransferase
MTDLSPWEAMWAAYDEDSYTAVLEQVAPDDVVLDIGAGDLRLARRLAARVKWVYAIEMRPHATGDLLPPNLQLIIGDARETPFPADTTQAVLLMRHCTHWPLYAAKLTAVNCRWLHTNARWGLAVERVDLQRERRPYRSLQIGWYACQCGATGFRPGPPEQLTTSLTEQIHELADCPNCKHG